MKEITMTCTVEITSIDRHVGETDMQMIEELGIEGSRVAVEQGLKEALSDLGTDDVHVRDLKLFIRDEESEKGVRVNGGVA